MFYLFRVGYRNTVAIESLAGTVDFCNTRFGNYACGVFGSHAAARQNLDAPVGTSHKLEQQGDTLLGGRLASRGQDTVTAAVDDFLQRTKRVGDTVEGTVERNLHAFRCCNRCLGAHHVNLPTCGKEAYNNTLCSNFSTSFYIIQYLTVFFIRIAEVATTRACQHMGTQTKFMDTITHILHIWGCASYVQVLAEFNPLGSGGLGVLG